MPTGINHVNSDLTDLVKAIEKDSGPGAIRQGDDQPLDDPDNPRIQAIPTGSLNLDKITGIGGIPIGRITEIYGPESSGKSTLVNHIIAQVQKKGGNAAYIDSEHAMDILYAGQCGLTVDKLLISQPDSAEQALNVAIALANDERIDLIVIDSVHGMVPQEELDKKVGEDTVAILPRLMSSNIRKLVPALARNQVALVFTNQLRDTINSYGQKETTTGGRALKFYASLRIELRRGESIKDRGEIIGNAVKARIAKNKCSAPFKRAEFDIIFNEGISLESEVLDNAVEEDIIQKSGAFYYYNEERIAQGRENARLALKNNSQMTEDILDRIRGVMQQRMAA